MSKLDETKKKRFQFLNYLYETTEGSSRNVVNMFELGTELGFEKEETTNIVQYLKGEYLVEHKTLGGGIVITHYGVKEVEEALSHPEAPTAYFPPVNIIQIHHMEGSQIQQGTISSSQSGTFNLGKAEDIIAFVKVLKLKLDELPIDKEDKKEVSSDIETIESQLRSSRPKDGVVKECLKSIRNVLEGAAGSILASGLLNQMATFFPLK
jgi:hypothetical protein